MKGRTNNTGFTLIELIMVIVILGILAAVAIPQYFDLSTSANTAAEEGVVGGVRAGLSTYIAGDPSHTYPATLDGAADGACTATNLCFNTVLAQGGISADWSKSTLNYTFIPTGNVYQYTPGTGSFLLQ